MLRKFNDFNKKILAEKPSNELSTQMEYFIEEKEAEMPPINGLEVETKMNDKNPKFKMISGDSMNNPINLAEMFHIKPEYFEFVRKHAINGGTGEIEFPTHEDVNSSKRPRFVATVCFFN